MLTIRPRQLKHLEAVAREDFVRRLGKHLAANVPACQDWDSTRTRAEIEAGIEFGRRSKIVSERGVARLVESVIASHGSFDAKAISKRQLNALLAHGKSEEERLDAFERQGAGGNSSGSLREFSDRRAGSSVMSCPFAEDPVKPVHWIEIQLIGEDNKPIPDVEYRIVLPSGEEVNGYLNENGLARVDAIEKAGVCKVSFPELDKDAWEPVATSQSDTSQSDIRRRAAHR